ncbi:MAG TPA: hypothetical protein VG652_11255 [Gaiellaceae bacterium]|nr:hypothetical protein [Gaiellaceae bacterium]
MDSPKRRSPLRSFALGGLFAAGAIATARRLRRPAGPRDLAPAGLAAFESAPCFRETAEREAGEEVTHNASS